MTILGTGGNGQKAESGRATNRSREDMRAWNPINHLKLELHSNYEWARAEQSFPQSEDE